MNPKHLAELQELVSPASLAACGRQAKTLELWWQVRDDVIEHLKGRTERWRMDKLQDVMAGFAFGDDGGVGSGSARLLAEIAGCDVSAVAEAGDVDVVLRNVSAANTLEEFVFRNEFGVRLAVLPRWKDVPPLWQGCWHYQAGASALPAFEGFGWTKRLYCLSQMESEGLLFRDKKQSYWRLPALSWLCFVFGYSPRRLLRLLLAVDDDVAGGVDAAE